LRDRKGIIFVAFDLPTETAEERAVYRKFRSFLIKSGYIMFQESLYYKIILNTLKSSKEISIVSANAPDKGDISALSLTLNEMSKFKNINGNKINIEELTEEVFFY